MIAQLVRKQIREMEEIDWGDIPDNNGMRLLWGENQELLPLYKKAIRDQINKVNLYPSPTKNKLKENIAHYNNVPRDFIIPTNGSDEALELIAKVFIAENDEVIMPVPSYPCFASVSQMMGAKIITVPLENDFSLSFEKILKKVTKKTKIIWIANPNNPTGNVLIEQNEIEKFIMSVNCLVVFDECYFELSGVTAAQCTKNYDNVLVTRSFTKAFALGGARLGYIIANREAVKYLNRLQQTNLVFNVNRFAQAAGNALLEQPQTVEVIIEQFKKFKLDFEKQLQAIPGLEIISTKTTFCFIKLNTKITGKQVKEKLKQRNIFIKDCSIYQNLGSQYIYLGVPKKKYQIKVVRAIKEIIKG
ncbi:MAG TPA: histidinol-phosphate transaminase [Candidatus Saccharimonadales bacterium]|nr:histidinol-phosphate transaminase [Candidatus Saccharimonadales bacterium]